MHLHRGNEITKYRDCFSSLCSGVRFAKHTTVCEPIVCVLFRTETMEMIFLDNV